MSTTLKIGFLFVCAIALVTAIFLFFYSAEDIPFTQEQTSEQQAPFQTEATDDPFNSLTIPYLQNRDYVSSMGEMTLLSESTNYETYLTNFESDDLTINALLTIPNGEQPPQGWPAIIFVHGYIPPGEYQTTERYTSYVDYLARNGFVVFKIDLRGHGDSEGTASGAYYSGDYVIDTLNAYAALESSKFVNQDKIGLWGHSMAGNVILRGVVAKRTIPAAVIWAGAVYTYQDFQEFRISDGSYRRPNTGSWTSRSREELFERHGQFDGSSTFWRQVVPTNYLGGLQTNIQIHHAEDDAVVSVEYTTNLQQILNVKNIPHEVHLYPSGGHNISGVSFSTAMQRTVDFFKLHLNSP